MKFSIGFAFNDESKKVEMELLVQQETVPVKSLVQVYFPARNQTLTYFNDQFDLKRGNFVFSAVTIVLPVTSCKRLSNSAE